MHHTSEAQMVGFAHLLVPRLRMRGAMAPFRGVLLRPLPSVTPYVTRMAQAARWFLLWVLSTTDGPHKGDSCVQRR
jgi:hypothetical protein